jgi:ketosteroid isomerase-like protein
MSQADVDLVRRLNPAPGVDWAAIVRDDALAEALEEAVTKVFDPACKCAMVAVTETWFSGFDGLRKLWLDWLEPWATYRTEEEATIDLGDGRVLYLGRDFGGRRDGRGEIELRSSAIWTIRDEKVTEIVFFARRDAARDAAGCELGKRHDGAADLEPPTSRV